MRYFKNGLSISKIEKLDIGQLWYLNDSDIFEVKTITGVEYFYPIYRWRNFYSFSPYKLIKLKGGLKKNKNIDKYLDVDIVDSFLPPNIFIDKEIKRVGSPIRKKKPIVENTTDFIVKFCNALLNDIRILESQYPNNTFVILTGGKDSLNLLLLPWNAKIIAVSQQPNYDLVKDFCSKNCINIEVLELRGEEFDNMETISKDALFGCCRIGLQDVRWSRNLLDIKRYLSFKDNCNLVVISGALADSFTTPLYLKYKSKWDYGFKYRILNRLQDVRAKFFRTLWNKGAQWQGVYHGVLRESTGIPNYSAYHGKYMMDFLSSVNIENSVKSDIRAEIGKFIFGKDVFYPNINPSPSSWLNRKYYSSVSYFEKLIHEEFN